MQTAERVAATEGEETNGIHGPEGDAAGIAVIREYQQADLPAIRGLVQRMHEEVRSFDPDLPPAAEIIGPYFEHLLTRCREAAGTFLVAESGGSVVGYVCVLGSVEAGDPDENRERIGFIADIHVDAPFQRMGIGRALMRGAEEHALRRGARHVELLVLTANRPALRLYEDLGYRERLKILRKRIAP